MTKDPNRELIQLLNQKFKYVEPQHLREMFGKLIDVLIGQVERARDPIYGDIQTGQQPISLNYMNRKHLFYFNVSSSSLTLTSTDNYTYTLPPQAWVNMGFRAGTTFQAPLGRILWKATDEETV